MRIKTQTTNTAIHSLLFLYAIYELVNSSLAISRLPEACNDTISVFIFELTASCCLLLLSVSNILPVAKYNPKIVAGLLLIATLALRVCGMVKAFEFAGRNVGQCYVEDEVGLWTTMQLFMAGMMIGSGMYLTILTRRFPDLTLF